MEQGRGASSLLLGCNHRRFGLESFSKICVVKLGLWRQTKGDIPAGSWTENQLYERQFAFTNSTRGCISVLLALISSVRTKRCLGIVG